MRPDHAAHDALANDPRSQGVGEPTRREEALAVFAKVGYDLERHPAHVIRRVHQRATSCFQQVMAGETLSPTQFAALATILKHGEISQNHLGRLTAMDPSTTSLVVRKLVKDGLISRSTSKADQRLTIIRLTDEGLRYTANRLERSLEVGRRLLSPLKPSEQKVFLALLERIANDETPL
ncbi:MarR family winged helix-turn-helix transcriptional regulator [Methylobacterium organophilum]|uniref:MarR family winged helix-turn-helix transcriptional regulator n=1 Tax=Methylobacterium organophilum TaxID=410 RepID=UPI001F13D12A|nr:MarR family winged helix-turn-helix transcriptional regulator [Methylobacterium organophilum]UMY16018.1 MarR family winged helix-turn-helix transcriptional regulator [Methylobacterium organophilum]